MIHIRTCTATLPICQSETQLRYGTAEVKIVQRKLNMHGCIEEAYKCVYIYNCIFSATYHFQLNYTYIKF